MYPSNPPPTVTIFRIPPTPSASYLAPGEVITSIYLMELAGMLFSTSFGLLLIMLLGFPLTCTLKLLLPFTCILSSPSTVTKGTFRSISSMLFDFESGSSSMLYSILSTSTLTKGFCATTSTPFSSLVASAESIVPRSMTLTDGFNVNSRVITALPMEEIVIT